MQVRWTPAAKDDLRDAKAYIRERNPSAAIRTVSKIYNEVSALKHHPSMGRPGTIEGTRELVVSSYVAVYRITEGSIEILRLYHGARDWRGDE